MRHLTIGQVARETGVNVQTVRYYERRGLVPRPPRRASGYRLYSAETVRLISFIRHAKTLGFSLDEISELLSLRSEPDTPCSEIKKRASAKLADVEERITALINIRQALNELVDTCPGQGPIEGCPIISALDVEAAPGASPGKKGGAVE